MKVYEGSLNTNDLQVENGVYFLLFDVTKTTPAANIPAFFGDLNLATGDNLKVLYTSRDGGQRTLIPSLPILPIAIAGTMGPQHIKAYTDGTGKITRVVFPVMIGAGGALALDNNSYISVSTNFSGISNLKIHAVDTVKSSFAFMYESIHLNASSQKSIDLANANQLIISKQVNDFQLLAKESLYSVNWSEAEIEAVARAQNDLLAYIGSDITATRVIQGSNVSVNLGFEATSFNSGGTFYNALGVTDFVTAKVTSTHDDRAYVLRVTDVSAI